MTQLDEFPTLQDISRALLGNSATFAEKREAVISLGILLLHNTKEREQDGAQAEHRARAIKNFTNLYVTLPSKARIAAKPPSMDEALTQRQQYDEAMAERSERFTPQFVMQLIALATGRSAYCDIQLARSLTRYVLPLAAGAQNSDHWSSILTFVSNVVKPAIAPHALLVLEAFLTTSSSSGALGTATDAWLKLFGIFASVVFASCAAAAAQHSSAKRVRMLHTVVGRVIAAVSDVQLVQVLPSLRVTNPRAAALLALGAAAKQRSVVWPLLPDVLNAVLASPDPLSVGVLSGAIKGSFINQQMDAVPTETIAGLLPALDAAIAKVSTSMESIRDVAAFFRLIPPAARDDIVLPRVAKLLEPITVKSAAYTTDNAVRIGGLYGAFWPRSATALGTLLNVAATINSTRCASAAERVTLLIIVREVVLSVLADVPPSDTPLLSPADATPLLRATVASAVPEVMAAAWSLAAVIMSRDLLAGLDVVKPLYKQAVTVSSTRRALLAALPVDSRDVLPAATACLAKPGLMSTEAMLALRFSEAAIPSQTDSKAVAMQAFTGDAIEEIRRDAVARRAATSAAIRLATENGVMTGVAALLCHSSGVVRREVTHALSQLKIESSCGMALNLWRAVAYDVFGVDKLAIPLVDHHVSPDGAVHALCTAANYILRHAGRIAMPEMLAEFFLCLGHPLLTQDDPAAALESHDTWVGRYHTCALNSRRVRGVLRRTFRGPKALPTALDTLHFAALKAVAILSASFEENVSGSVNAALCAVNGIAALFSLVSSEIQQLLYNQLYLVVAATAERVMKLDALTQAIVSVRGLGVYAYIDSELRAKGLLKPKLLKPPKGITEDEFELMQKKDAQALEAATSKIMQHVESAKARLGNMPRIIMAPFVSLRMCGKSKGSVRDASAAEVVCRLTQELAAWNRPTDDDDKRTPRVLTTHATEAAASLLTQMAHLEPSVAAQLVRVAAGMHRQSSSSGQQLEVSALALRLRLAGISSLPAKLFPVVLQIIEWAFPPPPVSGYANAQTQHLMMTFFAANCAQAGITDRTRGFRLGISIVDAYPGVFKTGLAALTSLAVNASEPAELLPLVSAVLTAADNTREAALSALVRSDYIESDRQTLVVLAVAQYDPRVAVAKIAEAAITRTQTVLPFAFFESDAVILIALLREHHQHAHAVALLAKGIKALLLQHPGVEASVVAGTLALPQSRPIVQVFHIVAPAVSSEGSVVILNRLVDIAEREDSKGDTMHDTLACARDIVLHMETSVLSTIQPRLRDLATKYSGSKGEHKEQLNAFTTTLLTAFATRADDVSYLNSVLKNLILILNGAQSPSVHLTLAECVTDVARHPSMRSSSALVEFGEACLKQALTAVAYVKKKGFASAFAGLVAGAGLIVLRKCRTLALIEDGCRDKQTQRSGSMILLETLTYHLGVLFEPYIISMTQQILDAIAEKDPKIAECADDAAKAMMSNLSDVGLRQVVPMLVEGLRGSSTNKKKSSSLGLISYIAYCNPKQLAATLPSVIPYIVECLFDANGGVGNAAFNALRRVAGTVANSQVKSHIDVILDAMRQPATDTEPALDALLHTRFATAIDPASLALLVPVVSRGLAERDSSVRGKAAHIVASLVRLVVEPSSALQPYAGDLIAKLEVTAQDPQPGVRASSAKAISMLLAVLQERFTHEVVEWCTTLMSRASTSSAEKCGAAQVLMEICAVKGHAMLHRLLQIVQEKCAPESLPATRESYMYVFVYAPSALPMDVLTESLPDFFPYVLQGLGDPAEKVRTVALQAGSNIISTCGAKHLNLILEPLIRGVADENSSARQSSLLLASKLLMHLVMELRRKHRLAAPESGDEGSEHDDEAEQEASAPKEAGVIHMSSARDAEKSGMSVVGHLEETLGVESFVRLMAAMHMARSEHHAGVRAEVTTAWQVCVASPRTVLLKIATALVELLVKFASSARPECNELAEKCVEYTCQRIHEMIDAVIIKSADFYSGGGRREKIGALSSVLSTVPFAEAHRLERLAPYIIQMVLPSLSSTDDAEKEERELAAAVVERVSKTMGKHWVDDMVQHQLDKYSVIGVVEIAKVKTRQTLGTVFKTLSSRPSGKPIQFDIDLISELCAIDSIRSEATSFYDAITTVLCNGAVENLDKIDVALSRFASFVTSPVYYVTSVFPEFSKRLKMPMTRSAALRAIGYFFDGIPAAQTDSFTEPLRMVLGSFGDSDGNSRDAAARAFILITAAIDRKAVEHVDRDSDATVVRRAAGRFAVQFVEVLQSTLRAVIHATVSSDADGNPGELPILRYPKLCDTILSYYNRALDYGTATNKLQSIEGIEDVVRHVSATARPGLLNTVMAKCVKTLYERNEGVVIGAVLNLLLHAMDYDRTGASNKILERTVASSVFGATLSDSPEARTLGLRVASQLLARDTMYADPMLNMMMTKKSSIDSPITRAAACRFVSVVMRHGQVTRPLRSLPQILEHIVRPLWAAPETVVVAAAAAAAMAALTLTASQTDDEVRSLADEALAKCKNTGADTVTGLACVYTLVRYSASRVGPQFGKAAASLLRGLLRTPGTDRPLALWMLRLAALLTELGHLTAADNADAVLAILKRVDVNDDAMMGTAAYVVEVFSSAVPPPLAQQFHSCHFASSGVRTSLGGVFDADFEDEAASGQ